MTVPKILNYGAGAVGLGLDSCLLKAGQPLDILARPATVAALKQSGLVRTGIFGDFKAAAGSFGCYAALDEIPPHIYDAVLVTVKSFDTRVAAEDLRAHASLWDRRTKIILCQNGWGNAEVFAEYFAAKQILNARIITGFLRPRPHEVDITVHADSIHVGTLFGRVPPDVAALCGFITDGGIPCETTEDIEADLWAKMLYNCALNPLSAVLDVAYGKLGEQAPTRELMNAIITEVFEVMAAAGHHAPWPSPEKYQDLFYAKLLPSTAGHFSSTLQDLKAGKRTEIDALTGTVLSLAQKHGVDTPVNDTLFGMIKFLEKKTNAPAGGTSRPLVPRDAD